MKNKSVYKHLDAYFKALFVAVTISFFAVGIVTSWDDISSFNFPPLSSLRDIFIFLLVIGTPMFLLMLGVAFFLSVLPFFIIVGLIRKYNSLLSHILGGLFVASPFWGTAFTSYTLKLSYHSPEHLWFGLYFIALGTFSGWFHYHLLARRNISEQ